MMNEAMKKITDSEYIRLRDAVADAEHLCKWLLQSDISDADRERVIRENGANFSLVLAEHERQKEPQQDSCDNSSGQAQINVPQCVMLPTMDIEKAAQAARMAWAGGDHIYPWEALDENGKNDWRRAITAAVPFLQEREGARECLLANMRWEQAKVRPGCVKCGATIASNDHTEIYCKDHILSPPATAQPNAEREPVDGDLVEAMLTQFTSAANGTNGALPTMKERMTAALNVAEPVIGARRDSRWEKAIADSIGSAPYCYTNMDRLLKEVRARIAAPRKAEERVTVKDNKVYGGGCLIAEFHGTFGFSGYDEAEKFAEQLRAKLRESEATK